MHSFKYAPPGGRRRRRDRNAQIQGMQPARQTENRQQHSWMTRRNKGPTILRSGFGYLPGHGSPVRMGDRQGVARARQV